MTATPMYCLPQAVVTSRTLVAGTTANPAVSSSFFRRTASCGSRDTTRIPGFGLRCGMSTLPSYCQFDFVAQGCSQQQPILGILDEEPELTVGNLISSLFQGDLHMLACMRKLTSSR